MKRYILLFILFFAMLMSAILFLVVKDLPSYNKIFVKSIFFGDEEALYNNITSIGDTVELVKYIHMPQPNGEWTHGEWSVVKIPIFGEVYKTTRLNDSTLEIRERFICIKIIE